MLAWRELIPYFQKNYTRGSKGGERPFWRELISFYWRRKMEDVASRGGRRRQGMTKILDEIFPIWGRILPWRGL